uniref:EGF-like domain-containing protein n=1 Tax=Globodera rostochiensis TaxID=31243 RepID=A0A914IAG1_GLORO
MTLSAAAEGNAFMVPKMKPTEEEQQQILPVYELLLSSDDSPSASLRVAPVHDGQSVNIRCAIATNSAHAFIPGTLTLHKNGKRVGTTADDGTVFTRRTVTVENSLNYAFAPWPAHRRKQSNVPADDVVISSRLSNESKGNYHEKEWHGNSQFRHKRRHHRTKKQKERSNSSSYFPPADSSVIFHCSALARPGEARRRGRVPGANLYQRTLKITRAIGAKRELSVPDPMPCPADITSRQCRNAGACVQQATGNSDKHFCECAKGFSGRSCEQFTAGKVFESASPMALCVSLLVSLFLFLAVVALGLALFRQKQRCRRSRTVKAMVNRLNDINESGERTPFEQIYDVADNVRDQSPIPALSAMSNGQKSEQKRRICSDGGGGYDNLDRLREEIRRQKAALEGRRRKDAETPDSFGNEMGIARSDEVIKL